MTTSALHTTEAQRKFTRIDCSLYGDLLQLDDKQRKSLARTAVGNGFFGTNYGAIVATLQSVYIEYDLSSFYASGPQSSSSVALVEQWVEKMLEPR